MISGYLNEYLNVLSETTKMFWIKELPVNPFSGAIGKKSEAIFLNLEQSIGSNFKGWLKYYDDYQVVLNKQPIFPLNDVLANNCDEIVVIGYPWGNYINKKFSY